MATFIGLFNWTEQGVKGYKDSPSRAQSARRELEGVGITIKEIYWTLGPYDMVSIIEAPDDETVTAALLKLGALGNVRTMTMRAFSREEFEGVVKKAG